MQSVHAGVVYDRQEQGQSQGRVGVYGSEACMQIAVCMRALWVPSVPCTVWHGTKGMATKGTVTKNMTRYHAFPVRFLSAHPEYNPSITVAMPSMYVVTAASP